MKNLKLGLPSAVNSQYVLGLIGFSLAGVLLWHTLPLLLKFNNPTVGLVDGGLWQLLLFSAISFMLLLALSILFFRWILAKLAFPTIHTMVLQYKNLTLWQQFVGYWASFALLFFGALLSLAAIF